MAEDSNVIEITKDMQRAYNRATNKREAATIAFYLLIWLAGPTLALAYAGVAGWLTGLMFVPWMIACRIFHNKVVVPRVWKYTVVLNQEQFVALGGKSNIPPPENFREIWKYQGERDFDYVINQYGGHRAIGWANKEPYVVRFRKDSDAVHFKLMCPSTD